MMEMQCLEAYFAYCRFQKNLNEKTLKAYRTDLKQFAGWLGGTAPVQRAHIEGYIEFLLKRYKAATAKRKIAAVKAYYRYLVYQDVLQHSPFENVQLRIRQETRLPRTIERQALRGMFEAAYAQLAKTPACPPRAAAARDVAVLELLFASGMRVSELCTITCDSLDLENRVVRIQGKGSRERLIYLASPQVVQALERYAALRAGLGADQPYFFLNRSNRRLSEQSVRGIVNRCAKLAAQPGHYTPHMFRHSFATYLWDQCGDVYQVKEILGHSSIKTTERYVHASFERQKRVLSAMHPRGSLAGPA